MENPKNPKKPEERGSRRLTPRQLPRAAVAAQQSPSQVTRKLKPRKESKLNRAANRTFQPCGVRRTSHATKEKLSGFSGLVSNYTVLGPMKNPSSRSLSSKMPALSFQIMLPPRRASLSTHRTPMLPAFKCCLLLKQGGLEHTRTFSFSHAFFSSQVPFKFWLRWAADQLYVNQLKGELYPGMKQNAKGGVTMSTAKYGGWKECFKLARKIANWANSVE